MGTELGLGVPLDRVTALVVDPLHPLDAAARIELAGTVTTSVDGSVFDPGMLFDFAAGGLTVVAVRDADHAYVLAPSGAAGVACAAAHVPSPCLVPRLATLAHARLETASELGQTLTGVVELSKVEAVPWASSPEIVSKLTIAGTAALGLVFLAAIAWTVRRVLQRRARTALGRILRAARPALRVTQGDVTLVPAHDAVRALVARARQIDASRRACARQLRGIDRGALERRAAAYARSSVTGGDTALAALAAEQAEVTRLDEAHASSVAELERIESALRLATLRLGGVGRRSGARPALAPHAGATGATGSDDLLGELDLRDQAIAEAEATN